MISRRLAVWLFLVGGCWLLSIPAQATSYTWIGGDATNPTDWEVAANWSPSGVPGVTDSATIGLSQTVAVSTDIQIDSLSLDDGSTVTGSGSVTVLSSFQATDVILDGTGVLTFAEGCHAEFRTNSPPNSSQKTKSKKKISNKGKAYLEGGDLILSADFDNGLNGTFYADSDGAINWTGTKLPRFTNSGKFIRSKGAGTASITIPFTNTGTVVAQTGVLDLGPNYTQSGGTTTLDGGTITSAAPLQFNGGVLAGTGVIKGNVVNSGGHVAPGHSPGAITILGNFTQTSSGTLDMQIAGIDPGVEYDQISVQGTATLAGTLNITWLNSYQPSVGDSFTLLEYFSCSGSFSNVTGFTRPNKVYLATSTTPSYYLATAALDNQPPSIAVSSPIANALLTGQFAATGTASDTGSGLAHITGRLYRLATTTTPAGYWNGSSWDAIYNPATHERPATGQTSWTLALPKLASGKYNVRATATDAVQNATSSTVIAFTVDNTPPPTLTITTPAANAFLTKLAQFKGAAADDLNGSGIRRVDLFLRRVSTDTYWTGAAWGARTALKTAVSQGNWASSFTIPSGATLPDGIYELTAQAFDAVGLSRSLIIKVTVDVTPPVVTIKSPLPLTVVKALASATGTAGDNMSGLSTLTARLTRYAGGSITAGYWNGTSWDAVYSAAKNELPVTVAATWGRALLTDPATRLDAKYNVRITAKDKSGNSATIANDFWVDAGLPQTVTINTPALGSFVTKLPSVAGTAVDSPGGQGILRTDLQIRRVSNSLYWNGTSWQSTVTVLTTAQVATSWSRTHSSSTPLPSGSTLPDGKYALTATTYDKALNSRVKLQLVVPVTGISLAAAS